MKKFSILCLVVSTLCLSACKKDVIDKKIAAKPKVIETTKTTTTVTAPYDYQKAITVKRTLNPDLK